MPLNILEENLKKKIKTIIKLSDKERKFLILNINDTKI